MERNVIIVGDVREQLQLLPDESVHCVVTSPPYWTLRDYGVEGQLGLEATREEYVANLVDVFAEVRRVLRSDGTLWLNMGDSYVGAKGMSAAGRGFRSGPRHQALADVQMPARSRAPGLKNKDLSGASLSTALALQADGWWLRADNIWYKPNPAPESTRDRPVKAHEYVFLLSKAKRYFYDRDAVSEPSKKSTRARLAQQGFAKQKGGPKDYRNGVNPNRSMRRITENYAASGSQRRNLRSVWEIAPESSREEHYASFPRRLVERCILAGTSEHGCCSCCGAPWQRRIEIDDPEGRLGMSYHDHQDDLARGQRGIPAADGAPVRRTVGWQPSCEHEAPPTPAVVLDPFMGSGTTALVAMKTRRDYVGIELNPDYVAMAERRLEPLKQQGRFL